MSVGRSAEVKTPLAVSNRDVRSRVFLECLWVTNELTFAGLAFVCRSPGYGVAEAVVLVTIRYRAAM